MTSNDIAVDMSVFSEVINKIQRKIDILEKCSIAMQRNMNKAAEDFNSVNFKNASVIIGSMQKKIHRVLDETARLKKFLKLLEGNAQQYLQSKFSSR